MTNKPTQDEIEELRRELRQGMKSSIEVKEQLTKGKKG
jgi:hypothetical protein